MPLAFAFRRKLLVNLPSYKMHLIRTIIRGNVGLTLTVQISENLAAFTNTHHEEHVGYDNSAGTFLRIGIRVSHFEIRNNYKNFWIKSFCNL